MNNSIIIIVILLLVGGGIVTYFWLKPHNDSGDDGIVDIDANVLKDKFNNEGFFVTNLTDTIACPNYNANAGPANCLPMKNCTAAVDVSNFTVLNTKLASVNGPSCFNVSLSWIAKGAAQITWGPAEVGGDDMNIGLFLDLNTLKKYIACTYLIDGGTNFRWNTSQNPTANISNLENAKKITADQLSDDGKLQILINNCTDTTVDNASCGLVYAGCGSIPASSALKTNTSKKTVPGYNFTRKFTDVVETRSDVSVGGKTVKAIPNDWYAWQPSFNRLDWDEYTTWVREYHKDLANQADPTPPPNPGDVANACKKVTNIFADLNTGAPLSATVCGDFWSYSFEPTKLGNKFRETEVTLFVPQKQGKGGTAVASGPDMKNTTYTPDCLPADEFVNDWRSAILCVYALPQNCPQGTRWMNELPGTKNSCCSSSNAEYMAKQISNVINTSFAANGLKRTIHAWTWKSAERSDSPWNLAADLDLEQIGGP